MIKIFSISGIVKTFMQRLILANNPFPPALIYPEEIHYGQVFGQEQQDNILRF